MMVYLATNSRPDISFAVNQCSWYCLDSKSWMLFTWFYLFVDADFAGMYTKKDPKYPTSVKSRKGWIVTLGGVPVTWASKLQTEIALSTMESEYIALSTGMRELVGIRKLLKEITDKTVLACNVVSQVS